MVKKVKGSVKKGGDKTAAAKSKNVKKTVKETGTQKKAEEIPKFKPAVSYSDDDEGSSSSEEPEWTQEHEAAFLKTLGALKGNKEDIYNDGVKFWDASKLVEGGSTKQEKEKKQKPMFLKDYERKIVLEKGGQIEESDEEADEEPKEKGYYEQQEEIRKQLKATIGEESDDDVDDILVKRTKTEDETKEEEEDFYDWIKDQDNNVNLKNVKAEISGELSTLKKAWNDPQLNEDDKFLRDYLLNKEYDTDVKDDKEIPAYEDIVDLDEDDRDLDKQRAYEHKYNFRFEEPDQDFIKQYPRTVNESLRKGNTKRKEKREERRTRKAEEKEERKKEIKQMKNMTKKEIEQKLHALREMAGEDVPLNIDDLQGDFDPKEYDRRMKELFESKYYGDDQNLGDEEMEKPVFSDMEDMGDSDDEEDQDEAEDVQAEEDEGDDEEPLQFSEEVEEEESKVAVKKELKKEEDSESEEEDQFRQKPESRRKRKRTTTLAEAVKRKKPLFDPKEKTFEEYFNEYYALDYEDILGDQVTKFKYRKVMPNNFGLDAGEVLCADDKQLNQWVSLRKVTAYRADQEEQYDVKAYQRRATDHVKKNKIFSKKFDDNEEEDEDAEKAEGQENDTAAEGGKKKKNKKKNKTKKPVNGESAKEEAAPEPEPAPEAAVNGGKKTRRRKKKPANGGVQQQEKKVEEVSKKEAVKKSEEKLIPTVDQKNKVKKAIKKELPGAGSLADSRLKAYGINPKKFKAKLKYGVKKPASE